MKTFMEIISAINVETTWRSMVKTRVQNSQFYCLVTSVFLMDPDHTLSCNFPDRIAKLSF
jgi:hypothetical protein